MGADGVLRAAFTRPIAVPPALQAEGYVDIVDDAVPLIAAFHVGGDRQTQRCSDGISEHRSAWNAIKANFLAPQVIDAE